MTTQTHDVESNKPSEEPVKKKCCTPKRVAIGSVTTLCVVTLVLALTLFVRSLTAKPRLTVTLPLYAAPLLPNSSTSHAHTVVIQELGGDTTELRVLSAARHNSTVMTFTTTDGELELYNGLAAFVPKASLGSSTRYVKAANIQLTHMAMPHSTAEVAQYETLVKGAEIELAKVGVPLGSTHGHAALMVDGPQEEGSATAAETALVEAPVLTTDPLTRTESEQVVTRLQRMFTSNGNMSTASKGEADGGRRLGENADDDMREDEDWPEEDEDCEQMARDAAAGGGARLFRFLTGFNADGSPAPQQMTTPGECRPPGPWSWYGCSFFNRVDCLNQAILAARCDRCVQYFKTKKKVMKTNPNCRVVLYPLRCLGTLNSIPPPPKAETGTTCNRHDQCASNLCSLLDTDAHAKCCPRNKWGSYGFLSWCNELRDGESCSFNDQCGADSTCRNGKCTSCNKGWTKCSRSAWHDHSILRRDCEARGCQLARTHDCGSGWWPGRNAYGQVWGSTWWTVQGKCTGWGNSYTF